MNKRTTKDFGGNQILHKASYNPKDCQVGVIHIGLGNFHRAHQAVYFHNLLSKMMVTNWGIAGVNLRPEQSNIMKAFKRCRQKEARLSEKSLHMLFWICALWRF